MNRQRTQLLILASVHVVIDMFPGALPAVLPALRTHFGLSLGAGVFLLTILNLTANGVQVATGHLRPHSRKPLLIPLGLLLGSCIVFCGFIPSGPTAFWVLAALVLVSGSGVAIVHPESLRAVNRLDDISRSVSSSVFMVGGFFGYYGGAWVGALLVARDGLTGLMWMLALPAFAGAALYATRIQLANDADARKREEKAGVSIRFWPLMLVAIPANTASVFIPNLLPTCLHSLGKELSYGGFSVFVFGMGGVVGALVWGWLARRWGESRCIITALALAAPFTALYLLFLGQRHALVLLAAAGFCGSGPFPLIVALAARARRPVLGRRMAFIVGGSWGVASVVMLLMGFVAERVGVLPVLHFSWVGYAVASFTGFMFLRRGTGRPGGLSPP